MGRWYCPPGRKPLQPIPTAKLAGMVGQTIHLKSVATGAQFILLGVDGDTIRVSAGSGYRSKILTAPASEAQYPRKASPNPKTAKK